ncbi:hypothetical protein [Kineococcus gypseus]
MDHRSNAPPLGEAAPSDTLRRAAPPMTTHGRARRGVEELAG